MPSKGGKDSPGLSQEQMLWGVLALLCTAVVCFAAGILVNKIQSKSKVSSTEAGQVERLPGASDTPSRQTSQKNRDADDSPESTQTEGVQVSPAPVVIPSSGSTASAPPSRPVTERDQNTQFVPAPPPQREDKTPATEPKPVQAPAPVSTPAPEPEPPAAPSNEPKPVEPAMTETTTPAAPEPLTPANEDLMPNTAKGGFTIQVGSFDSMANAEKFKKSIERKSDFDVVLYPVKDSNVVKACIGTFETKEAAAKEREQLDRVKDFKGCFVKALAEL